MTVAELIDKLKAFPAGMRVVVPGLDEGGYENIGVVKLINVVESGDDVSWGAAFDDVGDDDRPVEVAVMINFDDGLFGSR